MDSGSSASTSARDRWWLRATELAAWALFAATLFELWVRLADVSRRMKYVEVLSTQGVAGAGAAECRAD
jgi:hypothetical protein